MRFVMKKCASVLIPVLCFLLVFGGPASKAAEVPYFTFRLDESSAAGGDAVRLCIEANRMENPAAGFRIRLSYDSDFLEFSGTETSSRIGSGTFQINPDGDPIYGVYVCDTQKGYAPSLSGNIISFVFRVRDGAPKTSTELSVCIDQICDFSAEQLNLTCGGNLTLKITSGLSGKAGLDSLEPLAGTLEPEFSPDVYSYAMRVGYDVDSVKFRADAAEGGTVKVSRKSLNAAGTQTRITVTVTAEDGKTKELYTVTVSRAAKPVSSAAGSPSAMSGSICSGSKGKAEAFSVSLPESLPEARTESRLDSSAAEKENPEETLSAPVPAGSELASRPGSAFETETVTRNLYFVGNRMPEYLIGMLVCALCVVTGIALCLWLGIAPKK